VLPAHIAHQNKGLPTMTMVTGEPDSARKPRAMRSDLLRQIWINRTDYLYVLPAIVVMLIVIAYPIYYTIDLSFYRTPPGLQLRDKIFVGVDNYSAILTSEVFWRVTFNTVIWTLASTLIAFVLGFALALALHRDFFGRGILRAIFIIPWVISAVAASYIWKWIYHSDFGIIGAVLVQLGLASQPPNFIDSVNTVLPSLIVVNIWREFPFAMIMLMAGLQTVPEQLLRAAQVDGASAWQRFWHVTFPHLRGVSTVTILLLAVANFNSFIIPWIMTGGGPSNASHIWITHIYELAFGRQRWGVASAYSVLLFVILMTLGYFYVRALSGSERKEPGT
jgi:multiple sugar transport system permease protein